MTWPLSWDFPDQYGSDELTGLLPGPTARGSAADYVVALADGLLQLESDVFWLNVAAADLEEAAGGALDMVGDWAAESRQGLPDHEHRQIVAGRRVALGSGVVPGSVWRAWEQVTGSADGTMEEGTLELELTGEVDSYRSDSWRLRAQDVMRSVRAAGTYVFGTISTPDAFTWGVHTFDDAAFSLNIGA